MFGKRKRGQMRQDYNQGLLDLMFVTKDEWEQAKEVEEIVFDKDPSLTVKTKLAAAKYFYLFKEARIRRIKNNRLH